MTTPRLFASGPARICADMRALSFLLLPALLAPSLVSAQPKPAPKPAAAATANAPKRSGKFEDWTAATHVEAGQTVCYAFTTAQSSVPPVSGRGDVNLTVTQRSPSRDAVAISAGFTYPASSVVAVQADTVAMEFYTAQRSAFARDGKVAVQAFLKGKQVLARSPNPKGGTVTDQFSTKGFTAAYAAINKACPSK
jgi:hypothetical protein